VMGPGMMIQFDWVKVLPLWKEFRAWADAKEVRWLSLNRKTKVIYVKDWDEWFALLARFPLNLKNWKRIDCLPERLPVQTPDSVRIAYCDFFGFWRFQDDRSLVPDEQSLHLHKTHRDWQDYPYRLGGKRKWKAMPRDGTAYHAGPADLEGTELWIDS
ncbi:MAG: hypothetical protein EBX52_11475, partial [Proteobacteria bacterium]|nr:hypothetical protein [Pseudomonadota bacterium]